MLISTFFGKIPGPIIYSALEDKYMTKNQALASQICLCYFYFGVLITFILCLFKYKEKVSQDSDEVKIEDNIVNIAFIGSGTDNNDLIRMKMPVLKSSKTKKNITNITDINKDDNINVKNIPMSIIEKNEKEDIDDDTNDNDNDDDDDNNKNYRRAKINPQEDIIHIY